MIRDWKAVGKKVAFNKRLKKSFRRGGLRRCSILAETVIQYSRM
jgi:hypothetical protein